MRGDSKTSKARKLTERGLLGTGALLLAAFFVVKGWSEQQSTAGVEAFEEAMAASLEWPERTATGQASAAEPDYSLWSAKRIEHYEASLLVDSAAPQAVLTIDHLNIRVPVYNGASEFNLNRGVARIKGTARIGEAGNLGIAGHRDGFFRPLKDIRVGDSFVLETYQGTKEYTVSSIDIIDPSQVEVLAPTDAPTVTLVTCYPFYYVGHAPKRFIVKGEARSHNLDS